MDADFDDTNNPELLVHEKTYHLFNLFVRWSMVGTAVALTTLTLWFATPAGFIAGLLAGIVVFAAGYWLLVRHEAHQPLNLWTPDR